jgi:hypothetical protein
LVGKPEGKRPIGRPRCRWVDNIATYPGCAWLIRRVLDLMIEFVGPLYNLLQRFTNHWHPVIFLRLDTPLELFWLPSELHYSVALPRTPSVLLTMPSYNSSTRIPLKTPSSFVKNACLLIHYLEMDAITLLTA